MTEITIGIYFLFVLGVGIYSSFKIKHPDDYYVAGKKASLLPVSGSLLATILGGSAILGTIELGQEIGWAALWFLFSAAAGLFALLPLAKKVKRFGNYTLPELLARFYGHKAEKVASVVIPLAWIGIIAAQIIAAAKLINSLGYLNYSNGVIISSAVFIIYTLLGGQLSILKTDMFQALLIVAGLLALTFFAVKQPEIKTIKPFNINELFNSRFTIVDLFILLLTYSVTFVVGPDIYSRIFCAKNEQTARNSILLVAVVLVLFSFILTFLGVFSAEMNNKELLSFAQNLLPNWFFGIFVAAILSAVMSSADTTLLSSAIILTELFSGHLNEKKSLHKTRIIVVLLGILSTVVAIFITSIIQALLVALTFFSGAFAVPVILGLLEKKVNPNYVLPAIILGGIIALMGKIITVFNHELLGNLIIISAFVINFTLLMFPENFGKQKLKKQNNTPLV